MSEVSAELGPRSLGRLLGGHQASLAGVWQRPFEPPVTPLQELGPGSKRLLYGVLVPVL